MTSSLNVYSLLQQQSSLTNLFLSLPRFVSSSLEVENTCITRLFCLVNISMILDALSGMLLSSNTSKSIGLILKRKIFVVNSKTKQSSFREEFRRQWNKFQIKFSSHLFCELNILTNIDCPVLVGLAVDAPIFNSDIGSSYLSRKCLFIYYCHTHSFGFYFSSCSIFNGQNLEQL